MDRVIVYIDGFNLYFGICSKGWRRYLWLNVGKLAKDMLIQNQQLVEAKYFTAKVRDDPPKEQRQSTYLQALTEMGNLTIIYGRYQKKKKSCHTCHSSWYEYEEKMSDVNIASELLRDAFLNRFDTALLLSADADLHPPIKILKEEFPQKKIVSVFPPDRDSYHLRNISDAFLRVGRGKLANCQLPQRVSKSDGYVLVKPSEWN